MGKIPFDEIRPLKPMKRSFDDIQPRRYDFGITQDDFNNFINNSQSFIKQAVKDYEIQDINEFKKISQPTQEKAHKYFNDSLDMQVYLNQNKDNIPQKQYNSALDYIKSVTDSTSSISNLFKEKQQVTDSYNSTDEYVKDLKTGEYSKKYENADFDTVHTAREKADKQYIRAKSILDLYQTKGHGATNSAVADSAGSIDSFAAAYGSRQQDFTNQVAQISEDEKAFLDNYAADLRYTNLDDYQKEIDYFDKKINETQEKIDSNFYEYCDVRSSENNYDAMPQQEKDQRQRKYASDQDALKKELEEYKAQKDKAISYKNKYRLDHRFDEYKHLMENPDFEEKSKFVTTIPTKNGRPDMGSRKVDKRHEAINDAESFTYYDTMYMEGNGDSTYGIFLLLEDNEKKVYNYLYNTQGKDKAGKFLKDMEITLGKRADEERKTRINAIADKSKIASFALSAFSVPATLVGGISGKIADTVDTIRGKESNPYSDVHILSNSASEIVDAVGSNIAESTDLNVKGVNIGQFAYGTGMSMINSLAALYLGGPTFASVTLGSAAATQRAKELKEQGATEDQILLGSTASGIAEALFEKISLDKLVKFKNVKNVKGFVISGLKQAGIEASEEIFTEIANKISDNVIRTNTSDWQQNIDNYIKDGYSEAEAKKKSYTDALSDVIWAGVGGALSGGIMGGGFSGVELHSNTKLGKTIQNNNQTDALFKIASQYGEQTQTFKDFQDIKKQGITNASLGALYKQALAEAPSNGQFSNENQIKNKLIELGENPSNVSVTASAIYKKSKGIALTQDEITAYTTSEKAPQIFSEIKNNPIQKLNDILIADINSEDVVVGEETKINDNIVTTQQQPAPVQAIASTEQQTDIIPQVIQEPVNELDNAAIEPVVNGDNSVPGIMQEQQYETVSEDEDILKNTEQITRFTTEKSPAATRILESKLIEYGMTDTERKNLLILNNRFIRNAQKKGINFIPVINIVNKVTDAVSAELSGKFGTVSIAIDKNTYKATLELIGDIEAPITENFINAYANLWVSLWKKNNSVSYKSVVNYMNRNDMDVSDSNIADMITEYSIYETIGNTKDTEIVHKTLFGRVVADFKKFVNRLVDSIAKIRNSIYGNSKFTELAKSFTKGDWSNVISESKTNNKIETNRETNQEKTENISEKAIENEIDLSYNGIEENVSDENIKLVNKFTLPLKDMKVIKFTDNGYRYNNLSVAYDKDNMAIAYKHGNKIEKRIEVYDYSKHFSAIELIAKLSDDRMTNDAILKIYKEFDYDFGFTNKITKPYIPKTETSQSETQEPTTSVKSDVKTNQETKQGKADVDSDVTADSVGENAEKVNNNSNNVIQDDSSQKSDEEAKKDFEKAVKSSTKVSSESPQNSTIEKNQSVKENEDGRTVLGTEDSGLHGRVLPEEVKNTTKAEQSETNNKTDSNEPVSGIQQNIGLAKGQEHSGDPIQHTESNTESNIVSVHEQRNDSEGNDGRIDVSENQHNRVKKNKNNFSIDFDIDSTRPNINDNIEAIKVLKRLESTEKLATKEEKSILAKYKGWGGLANAFSYNSELKSLLTEEEFKTARASTNTSFYTSKMLIDNMYKILNKLGFKGGNILEPAMGTGNFFGYIPKSLSANSNLYGVEIDSLTGRIAQKLYPDVNIEISPFQDVRFKENSFDAIVGNVPFIDVSYKYKGKKYNLHDYFFVKSLDLVREGGVVAFITSTGTMDKLSTTLRAELSDKANLIAAYRLPSKAFSNAGTDVVTDLIILQKRGANSAKNGNDFIASKEYIDKEKNETGILINEYFSKNPQNVFGNIKVTSSYYGGKQLKVYNAEDIDTLFKTAISKLPKGIMKHSNEVIEVEKSDNTKPHFDIVNGKVVFVNNGKAEVLTSNTSKIAAFIDVRNKYNELMQAEVNESDDVSQLRKELNICYNKFKKQYGNINDNINKNLLMSDTQFFRIGGLEKYNPATKKYTKSDVFTKSTFKKAEVEKVESADDALRVSLCNHAKIDFDYMQKLSGKTQAEIIEELSDRIVQNNDGDYGLVDMYLSGNVREKLARAKKLAEKNPAYQKNVEMLEKVQPVDKKPENISVSLGASWIPGNDIKDFISYICGINYARHTVSYDKSNGTWYVGNVSGTNAFNMTQKYGTKDVSAAELITLALNQKSVKIERTKADKTKFVDENATREANGKMAIIKEEFSNWAFKEKNRRDNLVKIYNEKFNSFVPLNYKNMAEYITTPGMEPSYNLRDYQKEAVARIAYSGSTLLAHGVGTGKTTEMITSAMELKRMGVVKKNLFVVPKNKTTDFRNEILKIYPNAKVLAPTESDMTKSNRARLLAQIAANDFDIVIISHPQLTMLPVSKQTQSNFISQQLDELVDVITNAKSENTSNSRFIKDLEKSKEKLEEKLKDMLDSPKDDTVTFEELGVDSMFVDEAHNFKNLNYYTKLNVAGVGGSGKNTGKCPDLLMKCDYLRQKNGIIVFGTATPITNSVAEIYAMTKYVSPSTLENADIHSFDSWAADFGNIVSETEMSADGKTYKQKERFSKFKNVSQMVGLFRQFTSVIRTEEVVKDLPKAEYIDVVSPSTKYHEDYINKIVERTKAIKGRGKGQTDSMLLITQDGRAMATDLRLVANQIGVDEDVLDIPTSRINLCVNNVVKEYKNSKDINGTQFVFLDFGMDHKNGDKPKKYSFGLYNDIVNKLISQGIPKNEIACIGNYETQVQKEQLFKDVNSGKVRVLIGSTAKMGEGVNAQERSVALHHLNAPYRPSDIEQREGRIIRFGNINKNVRIYKYIQEKSFDTFMWQMLARKGEFINQAMSGGEIDEIEESSNEFVISAKQSMAIATGDNRIIKRIDLEEDIKKLKVFQYAYNSNKCQMEEQLDLYPKKIEKHRKIAEEVNKDITSYNTNKPKDFKIKIGKTTYLKRAEAALALEESLKRINHIGKKTVIGEYAGFKLSYTKADFVDSFFSIDGERTYTVDSGTSSDGNITRILNKLNKLNEIAEYNTKAADKLENTIPDIKEELAKPFKYEKELFEKSAELEKLISELKISDSNTKTISNDTEDSDYSLSESNREEKKDSISRVKQVFDAVGTPRGLKLVIDDNNSADSQQPIAEGKKYSLNYHAGDLGKAESLFNQSGNRGTGHFGTGTYFVSNKAELEKGGYGKRPIESVDFDNYNLYTPKSYKQGKLLHDGLSFINNYGNKIDNLEVIQNYEKFKEEFADTLYEYESRMDENPKEAGKYKTTLDNMLSNVATEYDIERYRDIANGVDWRYYETIQKELIEGTYDNYVDKFTRYLDKYLDMASSLFNIDKQAAISKVKNLVSDYSKYKYPDSLKTDSMSTAFMKNLGYEGVNVSSIKELDDTMYGSVIYDLKGKDLERKTEIGTAKYSASESTINAYYNPNTKEIHINAKSLKNPMTLLGHELFHSLDVKDQAKLVYFFRSNSDTLSDKFKAYKARRMQLYSQKIENFSERDFWNEFAAENCETLFTNKEYVDKLARKDRNLVQKIFDFIRDMLGRLVNGKYIYSEATEIAGLSAKQLAQAESIYAKALGVKSWSLSLENAIQNSTAEEYHVDNVGYINELSVYDLDQNNVNNNPSGEYDSTGKELSNGQSEYFKDSKVRDKDGNLLVVYHGSSSDSKFSIFKKGSASFGYIWTTDFKNDSLNYANRSASKNVYELYADIKNPKYIVAENPSDAPESYISFDNEHDGIIITYNMPLYWKDYNIALTTDSTDFFQLKVGQIPSEIYKQGNGKINVVAVRNSEQIKSVENLNPTSNPDIYYSLSDISKAYKNRAEKESSFQKFANTRANEISKQYEQDRLTSLPKPKHEAIHEFINSFARTFKYLPEHGTTGTKFAEFRKDMVQLTHVPDLSAHKAQQHLDTMTQNLSPDEFDTFEKLVYFNDLKEEINFQQEEGYSDIILPNNLAITDVDLMLNELNQNMTEKIQNALNERRKLWDKLIADYVKFNAEIGFDTENRFKRKEYYRHQVIDYMLKNVSRVPNNIYAGTRQVNVKDRRGWLKQRQGSDKAINTDFLFVEYNSLMEMQYDAYVAQILGNIKKNYDVKPQLERQAFESNKQAINNIIMKEANGKFTTKNGKMIPDSKTYEEQQYFNKRIMFGFSTLMNLAKQGNLYDFDGQFSHVARSLANGNLNHSATYQLIGQLASLEDYDKMSATEEAVIAARTILKYRNQKKEWIKSKLGNNYFTWETLVGDDYKIFQPRRGNYYYNKEVLNGNMFDSLVSDISHVLASKEISQNKQLYEQYKEVIRLMGAAFEEWVVPNEIVATMNEVAQPKNATALRVIPKTILTAWKGWATSVNPLRTVKFGIRNMAGDLDSVLTGNPGILKYSKQAVSEIYQAMKKNKYSEDFQSWVDKGGYSNMLFANEMDTKMQDKLFHHLKHKEGIELLKIPSKIFKGYFDKVEAAHNFRESILRYSAYLYYKNLINKNNGGVKDYVASNKYIIDGLKNSDDKAYQLSKDLLGAYDEISVAGKWLRTYIVPFYSFTETNIKRYARLFANIRHLHGSVPDKVLNALKRLIYASIMWASLLIWNNVIKKDDEEKLPKSVKDIPHITLGSIDDDVYAFTKVGSLVELMEWFGLEDAKWTTDDISAPLNKITSMVGPQFKLPFEMATGQSLYPDITKPTKVRDRWELFFNSFGLNDIYKVASGKPNKGAKDILINGLTYKYDYKDTCYYEIISLKYQFKGDESYGGGNFTPKSNALYYMKQAMKYDDKEKAVKYAEDYFKAGGTAKGFKQSMAYLNPMYGFTSKTTQEKGEQFIASLSETEKIKFKIAMNYYENDLQIPDSVCELIKKAPSEDAARRIIINYIRKS